MNIGHVNEQTQRSVNTPDTWLRMLVYTCYIEWCLPAY